MADYSEQYVGGASGSFLPRGRSRLGFRFRDRRSGLFALCVSALCLCGRTTQAERVSLFVLWGVNGRWDGRLQVENGRLLRLKPYSFETLYGDTPPEVTGNTATWRSGTGGQFDGIRIELDAAPDTVLRLDFASGTHRWFPVSDFPAAIERIVRLPGRERLLILGRGDPAWGPRRRIPPPLPLPPLIRPPAPRGPVIALPADWWRTAGTVGVRLSQNPGGPLAFRRVSASPDGTRLLLQLHRRDGGPLRGTATVSWAGTMLARDYPIAGSLWFSLVPRIAMLTVEVKSNGAASEVVRLAAPATLVQARGAKLFLNGEPFLVKGTLPRDLNDADAQYLKDLGANTLRVRSVPPQASRFGFMLIGMVSKGPGHICTKPLPLKEVSARIDRYVNYLRTRGAPPLVRSPYLLIAQLANEQGGGLDPWSGTYGWDPNGRVDYLLARCYNAVKAMCPMIPCGYSNNVAGYRAPDFLEVYFHNSFLDRDRGDVWLPIREFAKWQGCDPETGHRPWVMSEWGANAYMPEAWRFGPNLPVFEKIHAWNIRNRWEYYLAAGVNGGTSYCLYDYDPAKAKKQVTGEWDKGFRLFGAMTFDRKPKLAMWEFGRIWRDFEIERVPGRSDRLQVRFIRDWHARNCMLRLTVADERRVVNLGDMPPRGVREVDVGRALPDEFRWRIEYTSHGGLPTAAAGAVPRRLEVADFMQRLKSRETYPFLRELFDADVVSAQGRSGLTTLAEFRRVDGIVPVAFRKPNGVVYLVVFSRRRPARGWVHTGVTVDLDFRGTVCRVDELTGRPVAGTVAVERTATGVRLTGLDVPYIPQGYTGRAPQRIEIPVYRITPPPD